MQGIVANRELVWLPACNHVSGVNVGSKFACVRNMLLFSECALGTVLSYLHDCFETEAS